MRALMLQCVAPTKPAGFALPAALFLTFLSTTVLVGLLNRTTLAERQKYLALSQVEADHLARMGLEAAFSQVRNFTAGPSGFPATWTALPTPLSSATADERNDVNKCSIASQFASSAVVKMSPRDTYGPFFLRYYAVNEVDGTAGLVSFGRQWRLVACAGGTTQAVVATRSTLLRFGIIDNGTTIARGTAMDLRAY